MSNFKLIKTAAALALGASVVTSAVVSTDASAASKYKVKNGKLVIAKTGEKATGTVTFNKIVYKNGVKLTGLKGSVYYKAGKKATGTYKGAYYVNGAKKVTTGTYNKAYYVKGVKKVTTGLYASKYYKAGKLATGTYKGAYYVNGVKKVTTGTYNKAYYVKGVKKVATGTYNKAYYVNGKEVVSTGTYNKAYYVDGKKVVTSGLYDGKLYTDGKLNEGLKLVDGDLYNNADLNEGLVEFDEKIYDGAKLADGTFDYQGKEEAIEKGIKVGAKVASVEAINATQVKVTFNKTVDAASVLADVKVAGTLKTGVTASVTPLGTATANVLKSAKVEGKTLTLTLTTAISGENNVIIDGLKTAAGEKVARYSEVVKFAADKVAPTVVGTEQVSSTTAKVEFSEALSTLGTVSFKTKDGKEIDANTVSEVTPFASGDTSVTFNLSAAKVVGATDVIADGTEVVVTFVGAQDIALNLINPNPATATIKKVAADKVAPTVSSVTQTGAKEITVKFDKAVKTLTTTDNASDFKVGTTVATGVEKVSDTEYKITFDAPLEGIKEVKIAKEAITNVDGTEGVEFTKLVTFTKDAVAPKATSKVVTVNGVEFLELTFDKDVELAATAKVSLEGTVTEDYITTTVDAVDGTVEYANIDKETKKPTNKKVVLVGLENVKKQATYNLTVTPTGITSASDVAVVAFETSFTRGEDKPVTPPVELSEEVVSGVAVTQNGTNADEVKVTFSFNAGQKLDGASATNIANYSIANAEIESATLAAANAAGTEQVVTLKLKKNSNSFTGVRNATVKNVKLVNSKAVMEEKSVITDELAENVRATVLSAKITAANQITVTFSEKLNSIDKLAFDVKAGTDKVALDGAGTVLGTDNTTAVITLASDLTAEQLAKAITVESAKTADGKVAATYVIKDTKDNVSDDFAAITVVKP